MLYATGDTHGNFTGFLPEYFPEQAEMMTKDGYVLICGDFGGVWDGFQRETHIESTGGNTIHHPVRQRKP